MSSEAVVESHKRTSTKSQRRLTENITGYLFILPAVLIIALFGLFPILYSVYMSVLNWRVRKGGFIGADNYEKIFGDWSGLAIFLGGVVLLVLAYWLWNRASASDQHYKKIGWIAAAVLIMITGVLIVTGWGKMIAAGDKNFLNSLIITVFYALFSVPTQIFAGLVLAYILFQNIRGKEIFRMIYFLPYVTPVVSTAVVFRTIFSPRETSMANTVLNWFGIEPLRWLFESKPAVNVLFGLDLSGNAAGPSLALLTIVLFGVWTFVGYNTVIFLAGLGGISKEVYEAAEIDGASSWALFRNITVPLLSPVTFYLVLISFIGTFKAFNHIFVMTTPNAQRTVITASVQIFETFYRQNNFGYAAAQAVVLFLIILGFTLAQNKIIGERVFYG